MSTSLQGLLRSLAPWTPAQVAALQARQDRADLHPYTCPHHSTTGILVPTRQGWVCPVLGCGYWQRWAMASDTGQPSSVLRSSVVVGTSPGAVVRVVQGSPGASIR